METDIDLYFPPGSTLNSENCSEEKDVYIPRGNFMSIHAKDDKDKAETLSEDSIFLLDEGINDKEKEPVTERLTPKSPHGNVNYQDPQIFDLDIDSEKDVYIPRGNFMSSQAKDDKGITEYILENGIIFLSDEEDDEEEDPATKRLTPKSPRQNFNLQCPQIFDLDTDSEEKDALENKSVREYFSENSAFLSENKVDDEEKEPVTERLTPKSPRGNVNFQGPQTFDLDINIEEKDALENESINEHFSTNSIFLSDDEEKEPVTKRMTPKSPRGNVNLQGPKDFYLDINSEEKDALENKSVNEYFSENSIFLSEDEVDDEEKEPVTEKPTPKSPRGNVNFQGPQTFDLDINSEEKDALENKRINEHFSTNSIFLSDDEEKEPFTERMTPISPCRNVDLHGTQNVHLLGNIEVLSVDFPNDMKSKGGFFQRVTTFSVSANCPCVSSMVGYDHGQCWVADQESEGVFLWDRTGNLKDFVDVRCPVDSLTRDKDGNVFMSCPDKKQVLVFDRNRHAKTFLNIKQYPRGIAYIKMDDTILVCGNKYRRGVGRDMKACKSLQKYQIRDPKLDTQQLYNLADGTFGYPVRVCVNSNDDCIVSDFAHQSITVLDRIGRIRFSFKSSKDFPISSHHSVCCDNKGNIYIFSKGKPNVCVLESYGIVKDIFTCHDLSNEIVLASAFDSEGYLWVACMEGIIKIFKISR